MTAEMYVDYDEDMTFDVIMKTVRDDNDFRVLYIEKYSWSYLAMVYISGVSETVDDDGNPIIEVTFANAGRFVPIRF